jgi:hypothetical protein
MALLQILVKIVLLEIIYLVINMCALIIQQFQIVYSIFKTHMEHNAKFANQDII